MRRTAPLAVSFLALATSSALADVTPREVWDSYAAMVERSGANLAVGQETETGDTLRLEGVLWSFKEDSADLKVVLDWIELSDAGNGTVSFTPAPVTNITVELNDDDGSKLFLPAKVMTENFATVVSGTPDALNYDWAADKMVVSVEGITAEGDGAEEMPDDIRFSATLAKVAGTDTTTSGEMTQTTSKGAAETLAVDFFMTIPEDLEADMPGGPLSMTMAANTLGWQSTSSQPETAPGADFATLLDAGFQMDFALTYANSASKVALPGTVEAEATSGPAALAGAITGGDLSYTARGTDMVGSATLAPTLGAPFETVNFKLAEQSATLALPLTASETPREFTYALGYKGLELGEEIWGLFDPQGVLPRDPVSIELDLGGVVEEWPGFADPEAADRMAEMGPEMLREIVIRKLALDAVGATLDAEGAFSPIEGGAAPGAPPMAGKLNASATGVNGLLEKVVEMGLVPAEQLMGARMMLAMFAKPGAEPDSLTTEVEVTPEGGLLVNGQQIR